MSILELKQEITRLKKRDREEIQAHLIYLQQATHEWQLAAAHSIRRMQKGKEGMSLQVLENRLR